MQLWTAPTSGGALRHVGRACEAAAYSADGRSLLCAAGNSITQTDRSGGNRHRLLEVDGEIYSLSPSHELLRMAVQESNSGDLTQWEAQNDGSGLRRVLPTWKEARPQPGGAWTSDGRWFAFGAVGKGSRDLWLLDDERHPKQLTSGPLEFRTPTFSRDGKRLFCVGILRRGELLRYDIPNRDAESQITGSKPTAGSPKFSAMFEGISAEQLEYSPDKTSIVYITYPEQVLWRAKADGSDRRQLTPSGMRVLRPHWSADGSRIAFETRTSNATHWSLYMMSSSGGSAHELPVNASGGFTWSHDGRSLILGDDGGGQMRFLDLEQNTFTNIPESENLAGPTLSPDGAYIAAIQSPSETLVLFDFASHHRRVLARDAQYPAWSRDGQLIYFNSFAGSAPTMYRVRISDGRIEALFTLDELVATGSWGYWSSVAPDGSVLFMRDIGNSDIYAVDWQIR